MALGPYRVASFWFIRLRVSSSFFPSEYPYNSHGAVATVSLCPAMPFVTPHARCNKLGSDAGGGSAGVFGVLKTNESVASAG